MIVSFNFYYGRAGQADAVLQQRLRASEVRQRIGLPYGRVISRNAGSGELPDVIWEYEFSDVDGHHADMAVRAASPEFEAIRAGMRKLYRRFERPLFEVCGAPAAMSAAPLSPRVVALDWIFCAPENTSEVLAVLDRHAGPRAGPGLARGRLLRLITPGTDLPQLICQREYADADSYSQIESELATGAAAQTRYAAVAKLTDTVERSAWWVERAE